MRVTEQIDALEVMGINALNYLVFPKLMAMLLYPFVIAIAMFLGILEAMWLVFTAVTVHRKTL